MKSKINFQKIKRKVVPGKGANSTMVIVKQLSSPLFASQAKIYAGVIRNALIHSQFLYTRQTGLNHEDSLKLLIQMNHISKATAERCIKDGEQMISMIMAYAPSEADHIVTGDNISALIDKHEMMGLLINHNIE